MSVYLSLLQLFHTIKKSFDCYGLLSFTHFAVQSNTAACKKFPFFVKQNQRNVSGKKAPRRTSHFSRHFRSNTTMFRCCHPQCCVSKNDRFRFGKGAIPSLQINKTAKCRWSQQKQKPDRHIIRTLQNLLLIEEPTKRRSKILCHFNLLTW